MIKTIKEFAFESSDLPLILSLENHCSVSQQDYMADVLIEFLGIEHIHFLKCALLGFRARSIATRLMGVAGTLHLGVLSESENVWTERANAMGAPSPE